MHFYNLLLAALPLFAPGVVAGPHSARAGRHHAVAREASEALVAREPSGAKAHFGFPPSSLDGVAGLSASVQLQQRDPDPAKAHFGFAPPSGSNLEGIAGIASKREMEEREPAKAHLGFSPLSGNLHGIAGMNRRAKHKKIRKRSSTCKTKDTASASTSTASAASTGPIHGSLLASTTKSGSTTKSTVSSSSTVKSASSTTKSAASSTSKVATTKSTAYASASFTASSDYEPASSTASAAVASASSTTSNSTDTTLESLLKAFFPAGTGSARWSTVLSWTGCLSFTVALTPLTAGKLPSSASAPDGTTALIANYPAGTFSYSASTGHGYSFYSLGSADSVDITGAKEAIFSYSVYFPSGFDFVKGGKLPGLYGGTSLETAKSCSGGRSDGRDECFSARLMWRADGAGEIYNYLPPDYWTDAYCSTAPYSKCDSTYGESIGRGAFTFATGSWTTVAMRLKLNDYGSANGEQQLFVNGESVISLTGLTIAADANTKMYGIMAQTFFGGSDSTWASPTDQSAYFKDWTLSVLE